MAASRLIGVLGIVCGLLMGVERVGSDSGAVWLYGVKASVSYGSPIVIGIGPWVSGPASVILGHLPASGAIGEIAVTQAALSVGDEVPLPRYADGAQAQEGEVFWTFQLSRAEFPSVGIIRYEGGDHVTATFNGRQVVGVEGQINTGNPLPASNVQLLVTVIAVRSPSTPAKRTTFGEVKQRYR